MSPGKEGGSRPAPDRAPFFAPEPAGAPSASRPTSYSSQPKLRVSLGGEKRGAKADAEPSGGSAKRQRTE